MKKYLFVWVIALFCAGCAHTQFHSAAEKLLQTNNYDASIEYLVRALKEKPGYEESTVLMNDIAPKAYEEHLTIAKGYEKKGKYDAAVAEYDKITVLVKLVSSVPGNFPRIDVAEKREKAMEKAAVAHYNLGKDYSFRKEHKQAAKEFRKCMGFKPNYKDVRACYEKEKRAATKIVAIMTFSNNDTKFPNLGSNLTEQILSNTMQTRPEFVEFVSREYLDKLAAEQALGMTGAIDPKTAPEIGKVLGVHSFIFGKVLSTNQSDSEWQNSKFENTEDKYCYDKKKKYYKCGTYYARWTLYSRATTGQAAASYQVVDVNTGKILETKQLSEVAKDSFKYASCAGDSQALPDSVSGLCSKQPEEPKSPGLLVQDAASSLSKKLAKSLARYFRK